MKKILLMIPCLLTGGTEVATLDTARTFIALGYKVDLIVYFDEIDSSMLRTFRESDVQVHLLRLVRKRGFWGALMLSFRLIEVLRSQHPSIIWLQYMTPTLLPLLIARIFCANVVASVHVVAKHYSAFNIGRLKWLAKYFCSRFVCVSNTVAKGIFGDYKNDKRLAKRVLVIPNAVDIEEVNLAQPRNWRLELNLPDNVLIVGFVGRLNYLKGPDLLIPAVAKLVHSGLPLCLVYVGNGSELSALELQADQLGIRKVTHFAGNVSRDQVFSAIKGFDIAVVPSREEGFGLSALEAMAAGVPVVASRVDALAEIIVDGVTGLLSIPDNDESLEEKLLLLVKNKQLRDQLGTAANAHAMSLYDKTVYQVRIEDLMNGLELRSHI